MCNGRHAEAFSQKNERLNLLSANKISEWHV